MYLGKAGAGNERPAETAGGAGDGSPRRIRPVVRLEIPTDDAVAGTIAPTPAPTAQPAVDLTVEDLAAFAEQIGELVDDSRYRLLARRLEIDLARAEAASRRLPPPKLRLAE